MFSHGQAELDRATQKYMFAKVLESRFGACAGMIEFFGVYSQHAPFVQSQVGSVPVRKPMMTPAAQPTPDSTVIASAGQFVWQAPHSMQASLSAMRAFFESSISKTACGHTIVHILQPMHFSRSSFRVTTFFKYLISGTFLCSRNEQ